MEEGLWLFLHRTGKPNKKTVGDIGSSFIFFGYKWTLIRAYLICCALKQACVYLLTMLWEVLSQNSFSLVLCSWLCEVSEIPCVKEVIGLPGLSLLSRKPCLASVVIS